MEVCQWCQEEIKKDDKYIIGDPDGMLKVVSTSINAGYNSRRKYTPQARANNRKYHLECYKIAKKKSNKAIIWLFLVLLIIAVIIITITFAIVGII